MSTLDSSKKRTMILLFGDISNTEPNNSASPWSTSIICRHTHLWTAVYLRVGVFRALEGADLILTHPVGVGDDVVSRGVGRRQALHQPQDLRGVAACKTAKTQRQVPHTGRMSSGSIRRAFYSLGWKILARIGVIYFGWQLKSKKTQRFQNKSVD